MAFRLKLRRAAGLSVVLIAACNGLEGLTGGSGTDGGDTAVDAGLQDAASIDATTEDATVTDGASATDASVDSASDGAPSDAAIEAEAEASNPCPGQTSCSGTCVDTNTDLMNCGSCGVTCDGTCAFGRCTVTITTFTDDAAIVSFGQMRTDPNWLYYVVLKNTGDAMYYRVQLSASSTTMPTYVTSLGGVDVSPALAIDDTHIYYTVHAAAAGGLETVAKTGVGQAAISSSHDGTGGSDPIRIAVTDAGIYFVSAAANADEPGIYKHDHSTSQNGTAPTTLLSVPGANPSSIDTDGTTIYWTDAYGSVHSLLQDGGAPTTLAADVGNPTALVYAAGALYWADTNNSHIAMISLAGAEPKVCTLADTAGLPVALTTDGVDLYYSEYLGSSGFDIAKISATCTSTPATPTILASTNYKTELAMTSTSLYWFDIASTTATLHKMTPR